MTETESLTITSAVETLTGEESQSKEDILSGLFSGEGELQGVTCTEIILLDRNYGLDQRHDPRFQVN